MQSITITGDGFNSASDAIVKIGDSSCEVTSSTSTQISCTLTEHPAGSYPVSVKISGKGLATVEDSLRFDHDIVLKTSSPNESGFGGGRTITLAGSGFGPKTVVTVCGNQCLVPENYQHKGNELECTVPAYLPGN